MFLGSFWLDEYLARKSGLSSFDNQELEEEQQVVVLPLALRVQNLINRFIELDSLRAKERITSLREVSSSGYMKGKKSKYFCPSHLLEFHFSKIILIFYNSNKYF